MVLLFRCSFRRTMPYFIVVDSKGIVSMANNGPNTNGSQFFITYSPQAHLDGKYTVIGRVIAGFATLDKMENVPVGKKNRPTEDIILQDVTIHANPLAK